MSQPTLHRTAEAPANPSAEPPPVVRRRTLPDPPGGWPETTPPVLARVLAARGITDPAEAEPGLPTMAAPNQLSGIGRAAELLADAIEADRMIVVVGDFDCDGATGTAVATLGLRQLGARRIGFRVPHRREHGYGLSPALVAAIEPMAPELILTVDSGIACIDGVAAARGRGWQVVVSDHHLPGERLPDADAIVDPNLPGDRFPSKHLAGVGVVFYLLLAVRAELRRRDRFRNHPEPDLRELLDLVAIGTVADLVPLDRNNRILVSAGLRRIRAGRCRPGIRALAECAGRSLPSFAADDIAFGLAPRINAAGRLEDMALGIECLLADDLDHARAAAQTLDSINRERRSVQRDMLDAADQWLAANRGFAATGAAICLFGEDWHPGVIGLVASRVKDQQYRPTIAFAPDHPGSERLRGSARSIPGFHIRDALASIDARQPGLIERFGGHAMAAGLSLARTRLVDFEAAFVAEADARLDPATLRTELLTDGPLSASELNRELAECLRFSGPWGQGFPEPLFDNVFEVLDWRQIGTGHLRLDVRLDAGAASHTAIHFGGWDGGAPETWVRLLYRLDLDDFAGRNAIRLTVSTRLPAPDRG